MSTATPPYGPLTTPKAFQRVSSAHAILAALILSDLAGTFLWLLLGTFLSDPIWWTLRFLAHLGHASLLLDVASILLLLCVSIGLMRRHLLNMPSSEAWPWPITLILGLIVLFLITWLLKKEWIALPASAIPAIPISPLRWYPSLELLGGTIAAALSLLAHFHVFWRIRHHQDEQLPFSRAHPDGSQWLLIEQAYTLYRRNINRFDPPVITRVKTPATFYYYQYQNHTASNEPRNAEREMYWREGNLILNQEYIGPESEQSDILLPLLARLLYECNSPDHLVELFFRSAHCAQTSWFTSLIFALPLSVARQSEARWQILEREHVLDRDLFAYLCGEGKRLRKLLRHALAQRNQEDLPDNTIPTLAERIDHLDSLIGREAKQIKQLRETLPLSL